MVAVSAITTETTDVTETTETTVDPDTLVDSLTDQANKMADDMTADAMASTSNINCEGIYSNGKCYKPCNGAQSINDNTCTCNGQPCVEVKSGAVAATATFVLAPLAMMLMV